MIYNRKVPSSSSITGNALPTTKSNHINAAGDVEPCVFIHYSGGNIRYKSFLEGLQQPLFLEYPQRAAFQPQSSAALSHAGEPWSADRDGGAQRCEIH